MFPETTSRKKKIIEEIKAPESSQKSKSKKSPHSFYSESIDGEELEQFLADELPDLDKI